MSARLVDAVGLARARYLIFTAAEIDAHQAAGMGLIGTVVPHDELDAHVAWVLDQIRATGPSARAVLKREINGRLPSADLGLFSQVSADELREGMASFVEKRAPVWHQD
jgi:enoyl-CoA hydratase/carnithine racemase